MNRARGLLAAEHGRRAAGNADTIAGDIARPVQITKREQNEDHEQVGEPLKHVIRPGFCLIRPLEAQMVRDIASRAPATRDRLLRGSRFFRKCPVNRPEITYSKPVNTSNPGGLKVEIPAPAVLVRQHVPVAGRHQWPRGRDRQIEQRRESIRCRFRPNRSAGAR